MFIIIRNSDRRIVASSTAMVMEREGYTVYEIDDSEYAPEMVGSILDDFVVISSSDDQT